MASRKRLCATPGEAARAPSVAVEERIAGASPNSSTVAIETTVEKSSTGVWIAICSTPGSGIGKFIGSSVRASGIRISAIATPAAPAQSASTRLSASNPRTIRRRVAPSAARMAISRSRSAARASSRLATFAQAISSRKPTDASNTPSVGRKKREYCSRRPATRAPRFLFVAGNSLSSRLAMVSNSCCAWDAVAPGRNKPIPISGRDRRSFGRISSGVHNANSRI